MTFSRRSFLGTSLTAASAGLLLSACGPDESDPVSTGGTSGEDAPTNLSGTLRYSNYVGADDTPMWEAVVALFQTRHPDVTINFEPLSSPDFWTKRATEFANGTAPDVLGMSRQATLGRAGQLLPLEDYVTESELSALVGPLVQEGRVEVDGTPHQFALPWRFVGAPLHANITMMEAAGISRPDASWTRDDYLSLLKELTGGGRWGTPPPMATLQAGIASSFGAWLTDESGNVPTVDTPEMAEHMKFCRDLIHVHKVAPELGVLSDQSDPFAVGDVATYFWGTWSWPSYRELEFEWDVLPVPKDPDGVHTPHIHGGPDCMSVYSKSENIEAAVAFLRFAIFDPEASKHIATVGSPALSKTLTDPQNIAEIASLGPTSYEHFLEEFRTSGRGWTGGGGGLLAGAGGSALFNDANTLIYQSANSDIEGILKDAQAQLEAAIAALGY